MSRGISERPPASPCSSHRRERTFRRAVSSLARVHGEPYTPPMTSAAETRRMTAEELYRLPDDGMKHELVCGQLLSEPPAGWDHGVRISRLHLILGAFVRERGLGSVALNDTGFILARGPDTVRGPDVAFVCAERVRGLSGTRDYFPGAPDLAVEVLSPGDRPGEVHGKVADYLTAGVRIV